MPHPSTRTPNPFGTPFSACSASRAAVLPPSRSRLKSSATTRATLICSGKACCWSSTNRAAKTSTVPTPRRSTTSTASRNATCRNTCWCPTLSAPSLRPRSALSPIPSPASGRGWPQAGRGCFLRIRAARPAQKYQAFRFHRRIPHANHRAAEPGQHQSRRAHGQAARCAQGIGLPRPSA